MYIMYQCCQCGARLTPDRIHSYSKNRSKEFYLCKHFPSVEFRYETTYGFFTVGWSITITNNKVKCGKCKNWRYFSEKTFKKGTTHYNDYIECCDNVITFSGHEDGYYYNGSGYEIQRRNNERKILELKQLIEKLIEEIKRREKEEKLRREKEERLRKEREEKRRREREKMNRMRKEQDEESEDLDKIINFDTSWMEKENEKIINNAEITFSENINYTLEADIEKNYKYKLAKTH